MKKHKSTGLGKESGTIVCDEWNDIKNDMVNHPNHYADGGIECIEAMESMMTGAKISVFQAYLWGNIFKYIWRWPKKNGIQDLEKARWYLDRLIKSRKHSK